MSRTKQLIQFSFTLFFLPAVATTLAEQWPPLSSHQLEQITAAIPDTALVKPSRPRKLLVFSLDAKANHEATPLGKKAFELMAQKTGAFQVTQSSDPSMLKASNLAAFDALLFNNSNRMSCLNDPEIQESILSFVRGGKGFIGIHAAVTNFVPKFNSDWPEGAEMLGGIFDGHPWHEKVTIKVEEPDNPINAAFDGDTFEITDEIYQFAAPYSRKNVRVLLSLDKSGSDMSESKRKKINREDLDFPVSWVRTYGKGRVFYCSLGHDFPVFWDKRVLKHYLYGIQFALGDLPVDTTPNPLAALSESEKVRLDSLLNGISDYEYGDSRKNINSLSQFLRELNRGNKSTAYLEKKFVDFLCSDAQPAAKLYITRKLADFATDYSVPLLADLLKDSLTAYEGRLLLEEIGSKSARQALRTAADGATGEELAGLINSLGNLEDQQSIGLFKKHLGNDDFRVAEAAVSAIGKIGTLEAAEILISSDKIDVTMMQRVGESLLACAQNAADQGETAEAIKIYKHLLVRKYPKPVQTAAHLGIFENAGYDRLPLILAALRTEGGIAQGAAVAYIAARADEPLETYLAKHFMQLPDSVKSFVLDSFYNKDDPTALKVVVMEFKNIDPEIRQAAFRAFGRIGRQEYAVDFIALLSVSSEDDRRIICQSLTRMQDNKIDEIITGHFGEYSAAVQSELLTVLTARRSPQAAGMLIANWKRFDEEMRLQIARAMTKLARPEDAGAILQLMMQTKDQKQGKELQNALIVVLNRDPSYENIIVKICNEYDNVDTPKKCLLLEVMAHSGSNQARSILLEAIKGRDTEICEVAIQALAHWRDQWALDVLLDFIRTTNDHQMRSLAVRSIVQIIKQTGIEDSKHASYIVSQALSLTDQTQDKRYLLSAAAELNTVDALETAGKYLTDNQVKNEAAAALLRIADNLGTQQQQHVRHWLLRAMEVCEKAAMKQQAAAMLEKISASENPSYKWQRQEDSLGLLLDKKLIWRYVYSPEEAKPFFHPLALPDGTVLTWLKPPDHIWHRAAWFSWKYINGINYWEEDKVTGRSKGQTEIISVNTECHDDHSANIQMELSYHETGENPVLTEKRSLYISPIDPDSTGYYIDWESTFTAKAQEVLLDRTPVPGQPRGARSGGYAGLTIRLSEDIQDWKPLNSHGQTGQDCHGQKAAWLQFSGLTDDKRPVGVVIFDHPDNVRFPSPWYITNRPGIKDNLSPSFLFNESMKLEKDQMIHYKYRILIHEGELPVEKLNEHWKEFAKKNSPAV